ncbi:cytochrome c-type biogenesis protein CcmH [Mesobacillus maritimus]|uniref:cytochrome c-type biogenesis protein CcmH n=1 Tax=Mesobacillus maritimus TaxID=1643336 RepID=UPI00384EA8E1
MKRMFGFLGFLILLLGAPQVGWAEQPVKEEFDFTNPEFVATVEMLNMEGHSNDNIANCNVKQLYYDEVGEMLFNKGMSKNEIIDYYVKEQGIQALNSPPASGFNLSLWITPFLLITLVLILLYFLINRWKKHHSTAPVVEALNQSGVEEEFYASLIEEERKKYI